MAEYAIPNWIQPPDIAAQYYRGLELGQQAASEQQRLQFQQLQSERDHMLEQQRLQITKAYQDQQIQLRQQELQQAQAKINIDVQDAARRMEAYKKFQAAVAAGEDTVEAAIKYLPGGGEALGGIGTLAKAFEEQRRMKQGMQEPYVTKLGGRDVAVIPGEYGQRPQYHFFTEDPLSRQLVMGEIRDMERDRDEVQKQIERLENEQPFLLTPPDPTENKFTQATRKRYDDLKARLDTMTQDITESRRRARGRTSAPTEEPPPTAPAGPPLDQRPWDAPMPPAGGSPGLEVPMAPAPAGGGVTTSSGLSATVRAIRPKGAVPSSAPAAAPTYAAPVGAFGLTQRTDIPVPSSAPPTIAPPAMPAPAALPQSSTIPTNAPGILYDPALQPNTAAYGQAVRTGQSKLTQTLPTLQPNDIVAALKRLGYSDASYNPDTQTFYSPTLGKKAYFGLGQSGPWNREDIESQLVRAASEQNLNPLQ